MPRRALQCVVDLKIRAVSAPGVWLRETEDVYLGISLFGEHRSTTLVPSVFPLRFTDDFVFEKTWYAALGLVDISDFLEDEIIVFELLQLSSYGTSDVRLASYSCNARDFLFPYSKLEPLPSYEAASREILLNRTYNFPGILPPSLDFMTVSNINESMFPEYYPLEDVLIERRSRSRTRSPGRVSLSYRSQSPSSRLRTRSPSPSPRLRTRSPSPRYRTRTPPLRYRTRSPSPIYRTRVPSAGLYSRPRSPSYSLSYKKYPDFSDDDTEVAALTSSLSNLRTRSRSPSPYRRRYLYSPLTPSEKVCLSVRQELRRSRSLDRLSRMSPGLPKYTYRPYLSPSLNALVDTALDTSLPRARHYYWY